MTIQTRQYQKAIEYLYSHMVAHGVDHSFPREQGLARTKYLLSLLGDPQEKLSIIHVAGTSGKGSTAFYTSVLLTAVGKKVGLSVSPHLLDIRERFQINNKLIPKTRFLRCLEQLIPAIEQTKKSSFGAPTYFEVLTSLVYLIFVSEQVDYAIMEVGMGGLYDATNIVVRPDKVSVMTRIGLDHTHILGKTIAAIARQKLGIVQKGNTLIYLHQTKQVNRLAEQTVRKNGGKSISVDGTKDLAPIVLPTLALYQQENCNMALAVCRYVAERDHFSLSQHDEIEALKHAQFKGRMDVFNQEKREIIVDGAHNPQKIMALIRSIKKSRPHKKYICIVSIKRGKDAITMFRLLRQIASILIYTRFEYGTDLVIGSEDPKTFESMYDVTIDNPKEALIYAQKMQGDILVTGSLYLVSALYKKIHK